MTAVTVNQNPDASGGEIAMQNDRRMEVRGHEWNWLIERCNAEVCVCCDDGWLPEGGSDVGAVWLVGGGSAESIWHNHIV